MVTWFYLWLCQVWALVLPLVNLPLLKLEFSFNSCYGHYSLWFAPSGWDVHWCRSDHQPECWPFTWWVGSRCSPIILCLTCTTTSWLRRASPEKGLLPDVVELYAGGGMGLGAIFPGGQVKVSVDFNESATQHVEANNYNHVKQLELMMDLRCVVVTWFYFSFYRLFWAVSAGKYGPQVCDGGYMTLSLVLPSLSSSFCKELWTMDLRCVMVHDFICSFTIYFQQLLQGTMDRRCRLITNICKLFGDSLRTVGGHLTIITSTPSVE